VHPNNLIMSNHQKIGFKVSAHPNSKRLMVVTLSNETITNFCQKVRRHSVQSIEYKPFLRFHIADCLNHETSNTLGEFLLKTIKDRQTGAVLIQCESLDFEILGNIEFADFNIMLSSAVSHLIGVPNLDSMSGKFYARFSVKNEDNSDSYLRQGNRRMELHTDGTYVKEYTDWVLMQKMLEIDVEGGESLLLHLDDWQDLDKFYNSDQAKEVIQWGSPPSKNVGYKTYHPVFIEEENGKPQMSFIDQFAEPLNIKQGLFLYEIGESLEAETNTFGVELNEGSMLIVNNYCWLHGRDKFTAKKNLHRELLRQRGAFVENARFEQSLV